MTIRLPSFLHSLSIPTPFAVGPVNVYLVEGECLTLIDTGPLYQPARLALHQGLAALGYGSADLDQIILTHAHSDHYGQAAELVAQSGARVLTHPDNVATMADYKTERTRRLAFYGSLMQAAGIPPKVMQQIGQVHQSFEELAQPVQPDGLLEEGMTVQLGGNDWQVLHMPGHSGGLICLYQPELRLLISSDHLLQEISSNPVVEPPLREGAERPKRLVAYITQLERAAQLPIDLALPGHGPLITSPKALIADRLAFHRRRAQRILETLQKGPLTVYQITQVLFPQLDPINRFLAVSEVIGHLEWLQEQGKAQSHAEGAVQLWAEMDGGG